MARIKIFEAEHYVEDAEARAEHPDEYSPSVAIAHAMDAIVLAVDALCHENAVPPPRRHDEGQRSYMDLIRTHKIPEDASQWREFLAKANSQRTAFQYHAELTSRADARRFVQRTAAFVRYVRGLLKESRAPS